MTRRVWIEVAERDWTERLRAHTRSATLVGAQRTPAGRVRADIDLGDEDQLPLAVALVALDRRTHADQLRLSYREGLEGQPVEHVRLEAEDRGIALEAKAAAKLIDEIVAAAFPVAPK